MSHKHFTFLLICDIICALYYYGDKMKRILEIINKILFCIVLTIACLTTNSDKLGGYFGSMGTMMIIFKLFIIFTFTLIITLENKNNIKFVSIAEPIIICTTTGLLIFDYYVTKFSGSQFLFSVWWMAAIIVAQAAVFVGITFSSNKNGYQRFYRNFWLAFTPLYTFLFILCFARKPFGGNLSVNTRLGDGTFRMLVAFINDLNVDFEAPLIFFGNLLIFVPLAFILDSLFKKLKTGHIAIIGTILPLIVEGYQYIFKCGNVDIDDIVLNLAGFYIGLIIMMIIKKKRR